MDAVDRSAKKPRHSAPPKPIGGTERVSSDEGAAKAASAAGQETIAPATDSLSIAQRKQTDARARGRVEYQLGQLSDDNLIAIARGLGSSGLYAWGAELKAFGETSKRHQRIAVKFAGLGGERYAQVSSLCQAASEFVASKHSDVFANPRVLHSVFSIMGALAPVEREKLVDLLSPQILEPQVLSRRVWESLHPAERRKLVVSACYLVCIGERDSQMAYPKLKMVIRAGTKDHSLDQQTLDHLGLAAEFFELPNQKTLLKLGIATYKFSRNPKRKETEITPFLDRVMAMQYFQKADGLTSFLSVMSLLSKSVQSRLIDEFISLLNSDELENDGEITNKESMCEHDGRVLMRYASTDQRRQLLKLFEDGQVDAKGVGMLLGLAQGLPDCSNSECAAFVDVVLCIDDPEKKIVSIEYMAGLFDRAHPQLDRLVDAAVCFALPLDKFRASAGILGGPAAVLLSARQRSALAAAVADAIGGISEPGYLVAVVMPKLSHQILDEFSDAQRKQLLALVEGLPLLNRCFAIGNMAAIFSHFQPDKRAEFIREIVNLPTAVKKTAAITPIGPVMAELTLAQQTKVLDAAIEADAEILAQSVAQNPLTDLSGKCQAVTGVARGAAHLKGDLFSRLLAEINQRTNALSRIHGLSVAAESFAHEIKSAGWHAVVPDDKLG
jgi:hypothetical protein